MNSAALSELGCFDEALECYNKALELDPDNAKVLNNKGVLLRKMGETQEALKDIEKDLELNPDYENAKKAKKNFII